jgi:hypothetical protein
MTERHAWLRKALADRGFAAADVARAWGCHDSVLVRFIKSGEPKITAFRVNALAHLLDMPVTELLVRLSERPVPYADMRDMPLSIVAGFAGLLGMDTNEVLAKLEAPTRRRKPAEAKQERYHGGRIGDDDAPTDEFEEW